MARPPHPDTVCRDLQEHVLALMRAGVDPAKLHKDARIRALLITLVRAIEADDALGDS